MHMKTSIRIIAAMLMPGRRLGSMHFQTKDMTKSSAAEMPNFINL